MAKSIEPPAGVDLAAALRRVAASCGDCVIAEFSVTDVVTLIAQLQLAQRHPGNNGRSSVRAQSIIRVLIEILANGEPDLHAFLMAGFDPRHDIAAQIPGTN